MYLSIIVPVYNVEKYIRSCFESIFKQGLDDDIFELIIVNDGTKDRSMEVIADIISQHKNITVINQKNQGLSVARNNGMAIAKGEYILMLDSDDLLIDDSLGPILEIALSSKADMVITDFKQVEDNEIGKYTKMSPIQDKKDFKFIEATGTDLIYECLFPYYWRHLYKRVFLEENHISFIPGIVSQDIAFTNECFLKARKCIRTEWSMIIYRYRDTSTTYSLYNVKKAKNLCVAIARIWELTQTVNLSSTIREKQKDVVFRYFYSFTRKITYGHIKDISQVIEVIDYMKQLAPDLEFKNGFRQRFHTFMYRYFPHSFMRIRFYLEKAKGKWHKVITPLLFPIKVILPSYSINEIFHIIPY